MTVEGVSNVGAAEEGKDEGGGESEGMNEVAGKGAVIIVSREVEGVREGDVEEFS